MVPLKGQRSAELALQPRHCPDYSVRVPIISNHTVWSPHLSEVHMSGQASYFKIEPLAAKCCILGEIGEI